MKKYLFGFIGIFAAVAAFASVPPGTIGGDDVNPRTRLVTNAWENAKGDIMAAMADGEARPLPRYLHALTFFDAYPAEAAAYYATLAEVGGGCSAVRDGNTLARNFDFPFDDRAEFVITMQPGAGRFASVGVANVGTNLTEAMVNSGKPEHSAKYKWLPGATTDGVNENGVAACINVVSSFGHTNGWHGATVHYLAAVRRVLDTATNAVDAAADLAANVYVPQSALDRGYSFHYIVADRTATYIVEDGEARPYTGRVVMTNYRLFDPGEPYGTGRERAALLANPNADITEAWFTLAYEADTRPIRYSEFVAPGVNPTNAYNAAVASWANGARETRRGKGFWQSVHTSIYDLENLTLKIAVQEIPDFYTFAIPQGGKVKSVNGKTGDVTLDADDVGALTTNLVGKTIVTGTNTLIAVGAGTKVTGTDDMEIRLGGGTLNVPANLAVTVQGERSLATWGIGNALEDREAKANVEAESWRLAFPYYGNEGRRYYLDVSPDNMRLYENGEYLDVGFGGVKYENEMGGVFNSGWFDFVTRDTVVKNMGSGDREMPPSVYAVISYLENYNTRYEASTNYLRQAVAAITYETKQHAESTYATQTGLTAVSNLIDGISENIVNLNAPDKSQYFDGAGNVYHEVGMPNWFLTEPSPYTSGFSGEEFRYSDEKGYWFNDNQSLIWALGPAAGGASKIFIRYNGYNQWGVYTDNGTSVETKTGYDENATTIRFSYLGTVKRSGTQGGVEKFDELAYQSQITNYVPRTFTINDTPLSGDGITIEGMTTNALIWTGAAMQTKDGTKTIGAADIMTLIDTAVSQKINNAVNANMNTYIDGETGIEYVGKYYGGNLYYVPTGNVYPPNN